MTPSSPNPIPLPSRAALAELEASAAPAARLMQLFANEQRLMLIDTAGAE